ncbi:MAG: hypothetical protein ACR2K2_14970 [Mycobacteriales bacterium]
MGYRAGEQQRGDQTDRGGRTDHLRERGATGRRRVGEQQRDGCAHGGVSGSSRLSTAAQTSPSASTCAGVSTSNTLRRTSSTCPGAAVALETGGVLVGDKIVLEFEVSAIRNAGG